MAAESDLCVTLVPQCQQTVVADLSLVAGDSLSPHVIVFASSVSFHCSLIEVNVSCNNAPARPCVR